ncbi:hypothetical protein [Actinophytocola glycyrrhizae]|uniref:Uncharacterized protein n=1 Tax=Actinophytocola glycyrrhizae TaxID=2044873 RepID=A0ABV9S8U2_9PSEU
MDFTNPVLNADRPGPDAGRVAGLHPVVSSFHHGHAAFGVVPVSAEEEA